MPGANPGAVAWLERTEQLHAGKHTARRHREAIATTSRSPITAWRGRNHANVSIPCRSAARAVYAAHAWLHHAVAHRWLVIFIVRLAGSQAARRNDRGYQGLSRCASDVGGDDIGGVPVQGRPSPLWRIVVLGSACEAASCTSRSGTPASKLRRGNERVAQRVRPDGLGDPGAAGGLADDPGGAVTVQPASREISACSAGGRARRRPAARRARYGPARWRGTRSPAAGAGRVRRVSDRGVLLRPRSGRTPRWCIAAG